MRKYFSVTLMLLLVLLIPAGAFAITISGTLPSATINEKYSATLSVSGGDAPYNWWCDGMPSGLNDSPLDGNTDRNKLYITGTPKETGTFFVTVHCMDMYAKETEETFTLTIASKPQITTSTLPAAKVGNAYTATVSATGGTTPYKWTISGASWAKLDKTTGTYVTVSGTPDTEGTSTIRLTVTDSNSKSVSQTFSITVTNYTISGTLPEATITEDYSATLSVSGADAPYTWRCEGLPSGLNYSPLDGNDDRDKLYITGAPEKTEVGTFTVTVYCSDMYGEKTQKDFTLKVAGKPLFSTSTLPAAKVGKAYSATVETTGSATGGTAPFTWTLSGASWLKLDKTTGTSVTVSGTPETAGTSTIRLTVTDANNKSTSQSFTIKVIPKLLSLTDDTARIGQSYKKVINVGGGLEIVVNALEGLPAEITYTHTSPERDEITLSGTPKHFGVYDVRLAVSQIQNDYADDYSVDDEDTFKLTIYDENGDMPPATAYGSKEVHGSTESDAWEIDSLTTLRRLQRDVNDGTLSCTLTNKQYYKLTADIDLSDYQDWEPIGGYVFVIMSGGQPENILIENPYGDSDIRPFSGYFDGNGHTITININRRKSHKYANYAGLFGKVCGGIKNLSVKGNLSASLSGGGVLRAGGIAAYLLEGCIDNCKFDGQITAINESVGGDVYAGGIAGNAGNTYMKYSLKNNKVGSLEDTSITADGNLSFNSNVNVFAGGIAGGLYGGTTATGNTGTVEKNYSRVSISGKNPATMFNGALFGGYAVKTGMENNELDMSDNDCALVGASASVEISAANFPDAVFRAYVKEHFDADGDDVLSSEELDGVEYINVDETGISSLKGIEHFTKLNELSCIRNNITALDISRNVLLEHLNSENNALQTLDVSKNVLLKSLNLNNLIDTSAKNDDGSTRFSTDYSRNRLTALDVSGNPALELLFIDGSSVSELNLTNNPNLTKLHCISNNLQTLDVTKCTQLESLLVCENNLTALNVLNNTALISLDISGNPITALNVMNCTRLEYLGCYDAQLSTLDMSGNTLLRELGCSNNQITTLNVTNCPLLEILDCSRNKLQSLNVKNNPALLELWCEGNGLTALDLGSNSELVGLWCGWYDGNNLTELDISRNLKLKYLFCNNNKLKTLDISNNSELDCVACNNNQIETLDVGKNALLTGIYCAGNNLKTLDVGKNAALTVLHCQDNQITTLNVSSNTALTELDCTNNKLTGLVLGTNANLAVLYCWGNSLTGINVGGCPNIKEFEHDDGVQIINNGGGIITPIADDLPEFNDGHALVLDGQIGVIFYVMLPEEPGTNYNDKNCWMTFDIRGDTSNNPQPLDTANRLNFTDAKGVKNYAFVCYINSAQMADTITATLHYGNNQTITQDSSADAYLTGMMGKFSGVVKDLMIAIKDYGHYVQPMLSNANGWKIGELYLEMGGVNVYTEQDIEEVRQASAPYAIIRDTGTSKIASVGFALRLGSTTSILLYLNPVSGYTGSVTAYLEGSSENIAVRQSSGQYIVEIDYIPAHELHKVNRVTVNAGGSFEIQVSALSYVDTMLNKEGIGQDVKEAVTSLYKYWDAAMKYRASAGR